MPLSIYIVIAGSRLVRVLTNNHFLLVTKMPDCNLAGIFCLPLNWDVPDFCGSFTHQINEYMDLQAADVCHISDELFSDRGLALEQSTRPDLKHTVV